MEGALRRAIVSVGLLCFADSMAHGDGILLADPCSQCEGVGLILEPKSDASKMLR